MATFTLARPLLRGMPAVMKDFQNKCSTSYKLSLTHHKYKDKDAVVFDDNDYNVILCLYYKTKCISSVVGRQNPADIQLEAKPERT